LRQLLLLLFLLLSVLNALSLKIAINDKHSFRNAALIAAKEQGYFKAKQIEVTIEESESNTQAVRGVLHGEYDLAVIDNALNYLLHYQDLYMLENYYKYSNECVVMNEPLASFKQRTYALFTPNLSDFQMSVIPALLKEQGIRLGQLKTLSDEHSSSVPKIRHIRKDDLSYDASADYLYCANTLALQSLDNALVARKTFATAHSNILNDIHDAMQKGWRYALTHKKEMVHAMSMMYHLDEKELSRQSQRVKALLKRSNQFVVTSKEINTIVSQNKTIDSRRSIASLKQYLENSIYHEHSGEADTLFVRVGLLNHCGSFSFVKPNGTMDGFFYQLLNFIEKRNHIKFVYQIFDTPHALNNAYKTRSIDALFSYKKGKDDAQPIIYLENHLLVPSDTKAPQHIGYAHEIALSAPFLKEFNQSERFDSEEALFTALSNHDIDGIIVNELAKQRFIGSNLATKGLKQLDGFYGVQAITLKVNSNIAQYIAVKQALEQLNKEYIDQLSTKYFTSKEAIQLSLNEKMMQYLRLVDSISYCVKNERMPLGDIAQGKAIGMAEDLAKLLSFKLNIPFKLVATTSMKQSIDYVKYKLCDIALLYDVKRPIEGVIQSEPIFTSPFMIVTKSNQQIELTIDALQHKRIALVKGCPIKESLQKRYPTIDIAIYNHPNEAMKAVEDREVYGYVDISLVVEKSLKDEQINGLNIITLNDINSKKLGILVRDDQQELSNIINLTINQISKEEKNQISRKWLSAEREHFNTMKIFYAVLAVSLLFLMGGVLMYRLFRRNKKLELINSEVEERRDALEKRVTIEVAKRLENEKMLYKKERFSSMGEMIANIAHQWRQPLMSINGILINIEDDFDSNKLNKSLLSKRLDEVEEVISHMSQTIEDFRGFFDPNKKIETFNVKQAILQACRLLQGPLMMVELELKLDEEIYTVGHKSEFVQIIVAIVQNAIDATNKEKNRAHIAISLKRSHGHIVITITDNGGGISDEVMPKIFDPYFTTKHKSEGTGLGLYVSKLIIEHTMNGSLEVANVDDGACFTIILDSEEQ